MSLCWQDMEPLEDARATDASSSNANPSDKRKRAAGAYGKSAEARRVSARLLVWLQSILPVYSAPIPARICQERIRTATK